MSSSKVSDYLLESGAAILTGGLDLLENPLVIIHPGVVQQCELVSLLLHYLKTMALSQTSPPCITCVADLQTSSKNDIIDFVEALETVETPVRGRITALYLLKPKVKDRGQLLKKLLGLKTSKTYHKSQLFKVFLVKTRRDLHKYIEVSQLPEELGGFLPYDHQAWLYFYRIVTPCVQAASELLCRLPDMRDRVELLQEYDLTGQSSSALTSLRQELLQTYQNLIREAQLSDIVEQCKQTMHFLETPEDSSLVHVHSRLVQEAVHRLRTSFVQIKEYQTELGVLWDTADERLVTAQKIQKCREQAQEVDEMIGKKYRPQLKEHPAVGKTLSQAELYRTHFTAAVYEPAKELLNTATETLEMLKKLSAENPGVVAHCTDITEQLSRAVHPFTEQLQQLQTTYTAVHVFHILLNKSVHWYKKVLKFLPETLRHHVTQRLPKKVITTPPEWKLAVKTFLGKHPPPREEHIIKMDSEIPHQIHRSLKQQAHTVALRIQFLNRLLRSKSWPVKLVLAAFKWKDELSGRQNYQSSRRHSVKLKRNPRKTNQKEKVQNVLNPNDSVIWKGHCGSDSCTGDTGVVAGKQRQRGNRSFTGAASELSRQPLISGSRTHPESLSWGESTAKEVDVENLSERYQQNWEELASAKQLQRWRNRQNHPVTEQVQSYTFYSENEENKTDVAHYSPPRPLHSTSEQNTRNSPQRLSPLIAAQSKRTSTMRSPQTALGQSKHSPSRSPNTILGKRKDNSPLQTYPSTLERFVKLSLTPNKTDTSQKVFSFDGSSQYDPGSESGIEVTENEDPYDSVMTKIRAVSTSRLPSELKLKYVSELISCSLTSDDASTTVSVSDRGGQQRIPFSNSSNEERNQLNSVEQISKLRQKLAHSMTDLHHSNSFLFQQAPQQSQSLLDVSTCVKDRTCNHQFNPSLKCSFRPQDLSLVLEDVSGEGHASEVPFSKISSSSPFINDPRVFSEKCRFADRRSLSLDDLLDESMSLSQSSLTFSELDAARNGMDFGEWPLVGDTDTDSFISLQDDLIRLRECQEQRLVEVVELTEEQGRYSNIQLNAESVTQDNVEHSLLRSQTILQQEEAALYRHLLHGSSSIQSASSLVSETRALPVRLKKSLSGDQGYDSTSSLRTGVSSIPHSGAVHDSTGSQNEQYDTFDGPDFY